MSLSIPFRVSDSKFNLRSILPAYDENEEVILLSPRANETSHPKNAGSTIQIDGVGTQGRIARLLLTQLLVAFGRHLFVRVFRLVPWNDNHDCSARHKERADYS